MRQKAPSLQVCSLQAWLQKAYVQYVLQAVLAGENITMQASPVHSTALLLILRLLLISNQSLHHPCLLGLLLAQHQHSMLQCSAAVETADSYGHLCILALAQTYAPTLLHIQHMYLQSAALRMLSWCGCCCLQEALPNPSISNVELVPQLQDWADEAGDAERCKLFSKKAVRDAFAARVTQVGLALLCTTRVRGSSIGPLHLQVRTLQDAQACQKAWVAWLKSAVALHVSFP
jgi:hypothetical protein